MAAYISQSVEGRTVILVDDGIAAGSTMCAAIQLCMNRDAKRIIVAVPVEGTKVVRAIEALVDEVVVWRPRKISGLSRRSIEIGTTCTIQKFCESWMLGNLIDR
jgi:predicted phosphoribosyltransferase